MTHVTLIVEIQVQVPENTNPDYLHLGNSTDDFVIEEAGNLVGDAKVIGYTTTKIIH